MPTEQHFQSHKLSDLGSQPIAELGVNIYQFIFLLATGKETVAHVLIAAEECRCNSLYTNHEAAFFSQVLFGLAQSYIELLGEKKQPTSPSHALRNKLIAYLKANKP